MRVTFRILLQQLFHFPLILNILVVRVGSRPHKYSHSILTTIGGYLRCCKTLFLLLLDFERVNLHLALVTFIAYVAVEVAFQDATWWPIRLLATHDGSTFGFGGSLFLKALLVLSKGNLFRWIIHRDGLCKAIFRLRLVIISPESTTGRSDIGEVINRLGRWRGLKPFHTKLNLLVPPRPHYLLVRVSPYLRRIHQSTPSQCSLGPVLPHFLVLLFSQQLPICVRSIPHIPASKPSLSSLSLIFVLRLFTIIVRVHATLQFIWVHFLFIRYFLFFFFFVLDVSSRPPAAERG